MPLVKDRVKQTTTTTGTGTVALSGTVSGFQTFAQAFSSGSSVYYCIADGTNWEVGTGTYTAGSPGSLSRDTVLASSNSGAAVSWGVGTKDVFVTLPAAAVGVTSFPVVPKATAYTVAAADAGKLIVATGTWPLGLPAAASLPNGFAVPVINAGGGVITIDPNGSELVNGQLTLVLSAMQSTFLVTDNSAWYAVGSTGLISTQTFSATAKSTSATLSNSNLTVTFVTGTWVAARVVNPASGRYYWEMRCDSGGSDATVSVVDGTFTNFDSAPTGTAAYRSGSGMKQNAGSATAFGATWTAGDVIGVALDYLAGKVWFSKNGVWQASGDPASGANPAFTGLSGPLYPAVGSSNNAAFTARFKVADLGYSIPAGFSTLP